MTTPSEYRYHLQGTRYELAQFTPYERVASSGPAGSEPAWLTNIAHLACVAGANLDEPPNILCWFRAVDQELIDFKYFQSQMFKKAKP